MAEFQIPIKSDEEEPRRWKVFLGGIAVGFILGGAFVSAIVWHFIEPLI